MASTGAGVGQDEAAGQAGVEDHDEQDVGEWRHHRRARWRWSPRGPQGRARPPCPCSGRGRQATGVAPVMQLQQQAAQRGPQTLTLAAVHGCRGVTRQIAVDLAPGQAEGMRAGERRRCPAPRAGGGVAGAPPAPGLTPLSPAPPPSPTTPLGEAASS